jgi:hypothetical protein
LIFSLKIRLQTLLHIFYQSVELQLWWTVIETDSIDNLVDYPVGSPIDQHADGLNEDPTPAFTKVSAAREKAAQIANLLKEWHWSFSTLVKHWLTYKDGQQGMRSARKKADLLRVLLIEDAQATYKGLKNHGLLVESMELTTTFVVNGIRNELAALRDTMVFGVGSWT